MLKAVSDVPVPKDSRKNLCPCFLWDVSTTNRVSRYTNLFKEFKEKRKKKETRSARRTDLLNDQTLDKTAWPESETDFSESALEEWHARKEHSFPVSK